MTKAKTNKSNTPVRIGMMSLGCPKTLVDSELILGKLDPARYALTSEVGRCDVALLNTCSFIKDAQKESIDRILELIELKKDKQIRALVVMGCLVQQFPQDLQKEMKEVDAFVGSGDYHKIPEIISKVTKGDRVVSLGKPGYLYTSEEKRVALTPDYYRYLKISEGCDHVCTFCTIPTFRGKHRSRTIEDVVKEAERLVAEGARELILTGQDTTYFGRDYSGRYLLPELLRELDRIRGVEWIRVLYAYPSCITEELMKALRDGKRIVPYLDMPLQHASDRMLLAMKRGITQKRTRDLILKFRKTVPNLVIRTTFIVGFPGETEEDFEELLAFMDEMRFERLGIFTYSREAGSAADALIGHLPESVKEKRLDRAMTLQQKISEEINRRWVGKKMKALVEKRDEKIPHIWTGRTYMDAPEVDGSIRILSEEPLEAGTFRDVLIESTEAYDLVGRVTA